MLWLVNSRHADQIMICTGTQLLKNTKPNFLMLSQKNQSKCSTFLRVKCTDSGILSLKPVLTT